MSNYRLGVPHIGEEEKALVRDAMDKGMLTTGDYLVKLTELMSNTINQQVVLCSSGTAALHVGLHALGIKRGDEVIVPNVSFISTINAVLYTGATPVICDIGDPSFKVSINPEIVSEYITPKTKAIIVAHLFVGAGHVHRLKKIADDYSIALIEDAAQSIGCFHQEQALGTIGTFGIYSFNGNKTITSGGGGAITSSDTGFLARVRRLISQAKDPSNLYSHSELGFNYRLSNIHAAIGHAQLQGLNITIRKKKEIHERYKIDLDIITYNHTSNYWLNVCKLKNIKAQDMYLHFKELGIESRPIYTPFHTMKYLKKYVKGEYPVSERLYDSLICLPSDIGMSLDSIPFIIREIKLLESDILKA